MRQDDLRGHAAKDQGHGQAVQDEVVVFEEMRVRRSEPCHGARDEDNQRCPLVDQWQQRLVSRTSSPRDVDNASRQVCDEEGEQDDGYPEFLQRDVADLCLVRWEVVGEGSRPHLGAEVAGHADEEACEDQSLCLLSERIEIYEGVVLPVGPLKYPRYRVCVWYVSHVEKNMGSTGISAVNAPILVEP
jgi:hypothetical protein